MKLKQLIFWYLGILQQLVSTSPAIAKDTFLPVFIKEAAYVHRRIYDLGGDCKLATVKTLDFCQFFGIEAYAPIFNTNIKNPKADYGFTMHTFPIVRYGLAFYTIDVNRTPKGYVSDVLVNLNKDLTPEWNNKLHKNSSIKLTKYLFDIIETNKHTIRQLTVNRIPHLSIDDYSKIHVDIGNKYGPPLACVRQAYAVWLEAFIRSDYCIIMDLHTDAPNIFYGGTWWHVFPAILDGKLITYIDSDIRRNRYVPYMFQSIYLVDSKDWFNFMRSSIRNSASYIKYEHVCDQEEIMSYMQAYRESFPLTLSR